MTPTADLMKLVEAVEAARSYIGPERPDPKEDPEDAELWDNLTKAAATLSSTGEARVGGNMKVQRYFPSKPSHSGWEMTPDDRGDWVLWSDVVAALEQRRVTVERYEPAGLDSCQPISWLVKCDGRHFAVSDELTARWWADRLTTPAQPKASCTCPSGDGSLRRPCPVHPQEQFKAFESDWNSDPDNWWRHRSRSRPKASEGKAGGEVTQKDVEALVAGPFMYHHKMNELQEREAKGFDRCRELTLKNVEIFFAVRAAMTATLTAPGADDGQ